MHSEPGASEKELDRRIGMAHGKFAEMKKVLYRLNLKIRMKFFNTYIEVDRATAVKPVLFQKCNMNE